MNGNVQLTADDFRRMKAIEYAMVIYQGRSPDANLVLVEAAKIEAFLNGMQQVATAAHTHGVFTTGTTTAGSIWGSGGYPANTPQPTAPNPARPIKKSLD